MKCVRKLPSENSVSLFFIVYFVTSIFIENLKTKEWPLMVPAAPLSTMKTTILIQTAICTCIIIYSTLWWTSRKRWTGLTWYFTHFQAVSVIQCYCCWRCSSARRRRLCCFCGGYGSLKSEIAVISSFIIFLSRSYHLGTLVKYLCPWYPQLCYHVWKFVWWSLVCIVYGPSMRFKDWKRSRITNWIRIVKLCMWYKKKTPLRISNNRV